MKKISAVVIALAALVASAEETLTDSDVWNKGVNEYLSGNSTNALETLGSIMLSRTHGARASEVVGAIQAAKAEEALASDDIELALKSYEDSADAMQRTLRASPDDERVNRNFTRAVDRLPQLRAAARSRAAMKAASGKGPDQISGAAHREALSLLKAQAGALTNSPQRAIAISESLAARADRLIDAWDPLRAFIESGVTNATQLSELTARLEGGKAATRDAAERLADLDPDAASALASAETSLHDFWLALVMPRESIASAIEAQTNAYTKAETDNGREWNAEALRLTGAFRTRFPMWAADYEQQAQSDTNKPPFTAEVQAEISALATEAEKLQIGLVDPTPMTVSGWTALGWSESDVQTNVLAKLSRIQELMPKDDSPQNDNSGESGASGSDSQGQPQASEEPEKGDDDGDKEDQKKEEERQVSAKEGKDPGDEDAERLMERAQRRSDEHEADKKALMQRTRLLPNERDW